MLLQPEPSSLIGACRSGRYRLLEKLGEGAQGTVHRAEDPADGSIVAIKIVRTDRVNDLNVLRRFRKEARLMAEANNPFVVNLLEFNEDDGIPYMVLEFVAGNSLGDLLAERGRLAEQEALSFMAAVARGLMEAHERGIVHRDVKPSNILLLDSRVPASREVDEANSFKLKEDHKAESRTGAISAGSTLSATLASSPNAITVRPQVKVSDFGLARHVIDTESLALTAAGACSEHPITWRPSNGPVVRWIRRLMFTRWVQRCSTCWPAGPRSPRRREKSSASNTATRLLRD